MRIRFHLLFLCLAVMAWCLCAAAPRAFAQEYQPGDACTNTGFFARTTELTATDGGNFMICNGAAWTGFLHYSSAGLVGINTLTPQTLLDVNGTVRIGNGGEACDSTIAGAMKYSGGYVYLCNGSIWTPVNTGAGGLWTAGAGDDIYYNSGSPQVGIGKTNPSYTLDVAGTTQTQQLKLTTQTGLAAPVNNFPSALGDLSDVTITTPANTQVLTYNGAAWVNSSAGSSAAGNTGEIQFNSGGTLGASSNFKYVSDGDLLLTGTYTGTASVPVTGAGTRMFFDTQKAAFRAGGVTSNYWDNASIGNYSVGIGYNAKASNTGSVSLGYSTQATGQYSVALGWGALATNTYSVALGKSAISTNNGSVALGNSSATGSDSVSMGFGSTASGISAVALGTSVSVAGSYSTAMGWGSTTSAGGVGGIAMGISSRANGTGALAVGREVIAAGTYSMALGLGDSGTDGAFSGVDMTIPQVTGNSSFGIFMGDHKNVVFASSNTMGLFGGRMVIDPAVPATDMVADTALDVNGAVKVGYDYTACSGTIEGAIRFDSTGNALNYCDGASWQTIANGGTTGIWSIGAGDDIYYNSGSPQVGIGKTNPAYALDVAGSTQTQQLILTNNTGLAAPIDNFPSSLGALSDVTLTSPSSSQVLSYNGSAWVNSSASSGLWTDNTQYISYQSAYILKDGETMTSAGFDGGIGTAMIWNKDKGAFRAGHTDGTQWDEANTGYQSIAVGYRAEAKGDSSVAMGSEVSADGLGAVALGANSSTNSSWSAAIGYSASAGNQHAFAFGDMAAANGYYSMALGQKVTASSTDTMAIGVGTRAGTAPSVSGQNSFGIFMGDQSGVDLSSSNVMAIMGGKLGIGTVSPSTELYVSGTTTTDSLALSGVTGEPQPSYDNLLENLGDVNAPTPADGECLSWVAAASKWEPGSCGGGGLGSVTGEPAPSYDNLLVNLVDVNISSPGDGECVKWDNASSKWITGNCAAINSVTGEPAPSYDNTLDALSDVTITSPSTGNCLTYNGSIWVEGSCSGAAAGSTGQIQYNSGNTFAASSTFVYTSAGRLGIGTATPKTELYVVGDIEYTGELTDVSDRRLKKDIENLTADQLQKIIALQGVSFRMKDDAPDKAKGAWLYRAGCREALSRTDQDRQ